MAPEQIHAEMRATRSRIDRDLDRLQAKVADSRERAARGAAGAAAALAGLWIARTVFRHLRARARRRRLFRRIAA